MVKFSRAGVALASAGLGLLGLGMAVGNLSLLILSAFPLSLLAYGLATRPETLATATRSFSTRSPRRGDIVEMVLRSESSAGGDLLEIHAPLPPTALIEEGSNLAIHHGAGVHGAIVRFRIHGRGQAHLPPVVVEQVDGLGILAARSREAAPAESLHVSPRTFASERVRRRQGANLRVQQARLGVGSSDFRELRDYAWGDPPKAIHWRATARRLSSFAGKGGGASTPLVKDYDREGRRSALVMLDGGDALRVGTTLESGLDHGVEAALAACRLLLGKGIKVGAATFSARAGPPEPPESGKGQMPQLERALAPGEPLPDITPVRVLQKLAPHLRGVAPILIVVTRVTPQNAAALAELAGQVRVLLRQRQRTLPFYVVDVRALRLIPHRGEAWAAAAAIVERQDREASRRVAAAGAQVIPWRPGDEDLHALLARKGIA